MSPWATLTPPVAQEERGESRGTWGRTRDPGAPRRFGQGRQPLAPGLPVPRGPRLSGGGGASLADWGRSPLVSRSPGPPRQLPEASAPGAQVWPARQVQSALAPLPSSLPRTRPSVPACTARPPPWAREARAAGGPRRCEAPGLGARLRGPGR